MNRTVFLIAASALAIVLLGVTQSPADAPGPKPNIVFIFADDQCFETIHALGHPVVQTPNLDRLVREGFTFTQAHNMGSWTGAVCVASRTMLNTGRFLWNAHRVDRTCEQERRAGRLWSETMKRAGYDTYMTGKWHVKANAQKAFDFTAHIRPGMPNQTPQGYDRPIEGRPDPWRPWDPKFGGYWKGGKHWSEVICDDALGFIKQAASRDRPFFMYLAFNAPHDPRQSPREYIEKYALDKIDVPVNFLPEYPFKDAIGCSAKLRDERLAPFPRTRYAVKVHRREYYALITHMDAQIGRILDALKRLEKHSGKAGNTYIFFTADQGLAVGHHGLFGKQNLFEDSVRVPLVVVGPGVPHGKCDAPVYLQDVMPSTLELAGVARPAHVQFKSLMPLVRGEKTRSYDAIYGGYLDLQRSVKQDGYKLLLYPKIAKALLFNLKEDPNEMKDLAGDRHYRPIMNKLFATLLALQPPTGDKLDLKAVFPKL
jgi:arylsulfatase A-like enzyme